MKQAIIEATIEDQKRYARESKSEGVMAMFKGLNGKRFLIGSFPKVRPAAYPWSVLQQRLSVWSSRSCNNSSVCPSSAATGRWMCQSLERLSSCGLTQYTSSTYVFSLAGNKDPFLGESGDGGATL